MLDKSRHLEEANTALRVILKQLNIEKDQIEKRIISNSKKHSNKDADKDIILKTACG